MICRPDSFLDAEIVAFCLRHMIAGIRKVKLDLKIVLHGFQQRAELIVGVDAVDPKPSFVVISDYSS